MYWEHKRKGPLYSCAFVYFLVDLVFDESSRVAVSEHAGVNLAHIVAQMFSNE